MKGPRNVGVVDGQLLSVSSPALKYFTHGSLVGTFGFISLNQVNAKSTSQQIAQTPQQPNQTPDGQRRPRRPDFAAAAQKLGVTEQQLKDALGVPANPPNPGDRSQRPPRPDFAAAATKLGVTEQQLKDALGVPPRPTGDNRQSAAK